MGLHPSDYALERMVEVGTRDGRAAAPGGEDRRLVADVGEVGPGEAIRLLRHQGEIDVLPRLATRVHREHTLTSLHVGGRDEDLAVEATRTQQRGVELVEQIRGGDHDQAATCLKAVHLNEQLIERLVLLAGEIGAATSADGVELVYKNDRRLLLARDREQPADSGRTEPSEHL